MTDSPEAIEIREDDLGGEPTQALLRLHLAGMRANTPPEHVFALDWSGLKAPGITVWTAWRDDAIAGIGALRTIDATHGEIKSMRTHPDHLRRGVASRLLEHVVATARARGMARLSLETGRGDVFEPAIALYLRHGFAFGEAFADYAPSGYSRFMHRDL